MFEAILQQSPDGEAQNGQLETFPGITLADDVLPLLEGESAIYVRSATPIPESTVVLSPEDPEAAVGMLSQLMALVTTGMSPDAQQDTLELGEISARTLTLGDFVIHLAAVDSRLVLTTSSDGITDFGQGLALADDVAFTAAKDAAGMPEGRPGSCSSTSPRRGISWRCSQGSKTASTKRTSPRSERSRTCCSTAPSTATTSGSRG